MSPEILHAIEDFKAGRAPRASEVELAPSHVAGFVRLRDEPRRFDAAIFSGSWAVVTDHPAAGAVRLLKVVEGSDGVVRAIVRQGKRLFAYPAS